MVEQAEDTSASHDNLTYSGDEEPELHLQTWIAVAAMFMLNFVQVFALMGPPAVVSLPVDIQYWRNPLIPRSCLI